MKNVAKAFQNLSYTVKRYFWQDSNVTLRLPKLSGLRLINLAFQEIETLKQELNLVIDENNIYYCEGRLRESPLPF